MLTHTHSKNLVKFMSYTILILKRCYVKEIYNRILDGIFMAINNKSLIAFSYTTFLR